MFKMVFLVNRRPGMSREDFSRYWKETHAPIAARIPGLRRYVQNHVSGDVDGGVTYDGIAEMCWDSREAFEEAMASPEGKEAAADAGTFMDAEQILTFNVDEVIVA